MPILAVVNASVVAFTSSRVVCYWRWLDVGEDDGKVKRVLKLRGEDQCL